MSTMPSETDKTEKNTIQELITLALHQANEISYDLYYFKIKSKGIHMKIQNDINSFKLYADKSVLHDLDEMRIKKEDSFEKMLNALNDWNLELKKVAAVIAELRKLSKPEDQSPNITELSPNQTCNKLRALNYALYYKNLHMKWVSAWLKTQLAHKRLQQEATINLLNMCLQNEDLFETSSSTYKYGSTSKLTPSLSDMISNINEMISNLSFKSADEVPASKPSNFDEKQPPTVESGPTDIHSETKPQITSSPSNPKVYTFGVKPKTSEPSQASQDFSWKYQPRIFKHAKRTGTNKPQNKHQSMNETSKPQPDVPSSNAKVYIFGGEMTTSEPHQASHESSLKVEPPIFKSENVKNDTKPQINNLPRNPPTKPFEAKSTPTTAKNVDSNSTQASKESSSNNLPRPPRLLKTFKYKSANVSGTSKPQNNGPPCNPRDNLAGDEPMTSDGTAPARFSPPTGADTIDNTKEYKKKSLEKQHFEDDIAGRKDPSLYVFESQLKNNTTFPRRIRVSGKSTRNRETTTQNYDTSTKNRKTPPQKFATSTQNRDTPPQCFDTPKQNQEIPTQSYDSPTQNRETLTPHFDTSKQNRESPAQFFDSQTQKRETPTQHDCQTQNRETPSLFVFVSQLKNNAPIPRRIRVSVKSTRNHEIPTQNYDTSTKNRDTPTQYFDTPKQNQEIPTQSFDSSTQNRGTSAQEFDTSTQNLENPTQHCDTTTQNSENPAQRCDTSTQNRESPAQFFYSETQSRQSPTQFVDNATQNRETPTQFYDCQTQNRESPTQFFDSQTQTREASTHNRETPPNVEPSVSDENAAAAERLLEAGKVEEAFKVSSDALKLDPENAYILVFRARAYYDLKKYREALEDLQKAVAILPILPANVSVYIAKCSLRLGQIASGEQAIRHAIEHNLGLQEKTVTSSEVEKLREAFTSLRSLQESAHRLMSEHKHFDAVYFIDDCLKNYCPACSKMKLLKAECLAHMGKFNEARSIAIDTSLLSTNVCSGAVYADAMYVVGLCSYFQEHDEMAIKKFRKVLEHDPDHEKALKMIKLTKTRKNTKLIIQKREEGNKAFNAGVWTKALNFYNEALSIDKNNKLENAKLHYNRATVFAKQNQLSNAIDACTAAIELDLNYIKALLRRAQCYTEIGMYEKALEDYEKLYCIDSTDEYRRLLQEANETLMANKGPYYYYKILGISKYATLDEIKKAYKKCAMRYHPDRHACASLGEVRTNERKFKQAKEAYDTLGEERSRQNYDRSQRRYDTESEDEYL